MTRSLDDAVRLGEPLIDIVVTFKKGVDYEQATAALNSLGSDMQFMKGHWYGEPRCRIGCVTAEGAHRLFGAHFRRVPHPSNSNIHVWSATKIEEWPEQVVPFVQSIGTSQPGANDDGQPYVPIFDR